MSFGAASAAAGEAVRLLLSHVVCPDLVYIHKLDEIRLDTFVECLSESVPPEFNFIFIIVKDAVCVYMTRVSTLLILVTCSTFHLFRSSLFFPYT